MKRDHPEYYALYNGDRLNKVKAGKQCLSSPGLLKQSVAYARALFDHRNHQGIGRRPVKTLSWYMNLCRRRTRETGTEIKAFSPTDTDDTLVPERFAKFYQ